MKIYYCSMDGGEFGSPDKEYIQKQVDFRNNDNEYDDIFSEIRLVEKEIEKEELGLCWNNFPRDYKMFLVCKDDSQCAVGQFV